MRERIIERARERKEVERKKEGMRLGRREKRGRKDWCLDLRVFSGTELIVMLHVSCRATVNYSRFTMEASSPPLYWFTHDALVLILLPPP